VHRQLHIEATVDRLHRMGVEVDLLPPKIPYLETIKAPQNVEGKHKKQTGGPRPVRSLLRRHCASARGSGFEFEDAIVGGAVPASSSRPSRRGCAPAWPGGLSPDTA